MPELNSPVVQSYQIQPWDEGIYVGVGNSLWRNLEAAIINQRRASIAIFLNHVPRTVTLVKLIPIEDNWDISLG